MRKSANGQSLIKAKPQTKPVAVPNSPLKQPPSAPLVNHLTQSIGFKLQ